MQCGVDPFCLGALNGKNSSLAFVVLTKRTPEVVDFNEELHTGAAARLNAALLGDLLVVLDPWIGANSGANRYRINVAV